MEPRQPGNSLSDQGPSASPVPQDGFSIQTLYYRVPASRVATPMSPLQKKTNLLLTEDVY